MDWTNESILQFLRLYKTHPCIWNTKHKLNRNRDAVNDAWALLHKSMQETMTCTIPQLKKKKESLMSAYRAYKTKIHNSKSVDGRSVYKPSWFAFATMDSFLSTVYLCNPTPWSKIYHTEWIPIDKQEPNTAGEDPDSNPWDADAAANTTTSRGSKRSQTHEQAETYQPKRHRGISKTNTPVQYETYVPIEEDECTIVAKLWARKLRKLPEDRRDLLIYKINSIMYKEMVNYNRAGSSSPGIKIPSPVQIFHEDNSDMSDNNSCDEGRMTDNS